MQRRLFPAVFLLPSLIGCTAGPSSDENTSRAVFFDADSAALGENAFANMGPLLEAARANPAIPVRVLGFAAPDTGSAAFNRALAQARAQNVADGLIDAGVPRN